MSARIMNALNDIGHNVHLLHFHPRFGSEVSQDIQRTNLIIHNKQIFSQWRNALKQAEVLKTALTETPPDVLVVAQGYPESGALALIIAKQTKVKAVSYIPFGYTADELHKSFGHLRKLIQRRLFRLPSGHITIDEPQRKLLARHTRHRNHPIHIVPNPFDLNPDKLAFELNAGANTVIVTAGRLNFSQKNQNLIPQVAAILGSRTTRFSFKIIGSGQDSQALAAAIRSYSVDRYVEVIPEMHHSKLLDYLREYADVVLLPSHYEGFPLIFLEALALGKPVISSPLDFLSIYPIQEYMTINPRSAVDAAHAIENFSAQFNADDYDKLRESILSNHSLNQYHNQVREITKFVTELV